MSLPRHQAWAVIGPVGANYQSHRQTSHSLI